MRTKRRLYWDSSCFIALVNQEATTDHAKLSALRDTFSEMTSARLQIVTSDIFRFEVQLSTAEESESLRRQLLACRSFEFLIRNQQVEDLARELQVRAQLSGRRIKMADGFHLATAILSRSEALWTTDRRMIQLGTAGIISELEITAPTVPQPRLWIE